MTLAAGTRLGPYEIVGQIGAGGMGEVWKAKDTRLGRDVAIKVLPAAFAEAPERLKRFEQEARMVAALSHPNVLAIFDVGTHEGSPYLVSELLKGGTLRERLSGGALPVSKTLDIAIQVARGLAAAHDKGIIHRDLKPENIFLTQDGVKILDFGLAKQAPVIREGSQSELPTRDLANATQEGAILGTVGYMSPEQVRGEAVDARSDLFALGVVIYEMLSGRQAFRGRTPVDTLSAILREEPPDLDAGLKVPPLLERVMRSCLSKEVEGRFHSAHDLAFALQSAIDAGTPSMGSAPMVLTISGEQKPALRVWLWKVPAERRSMALIAAGAFVVLTAAAGLWLWRPWRPAMPPYDPRTVAILPFENRTGEASLDGLSQQGVDLVRQTLQQVGDLKVAADSAVPPGRADPEQRIAMATRARFVASGSYYRKAGEVEFQARIVDPWNGKVIYSLGPWRGPQEDPARALQELRQYLSGAIAWCFSNAAGAGEMEPGATRPPRMDAWLLFQKGYQSAHSDPEGLIANCRAALALDPDFFWPRWWLLDHYSDTGEDDKAAQVLKEMDQHSGKATAVERIWMRQCRAYFENHPMQVMKAIDDLRLIHPDTPSLRFKRAEAAIRVNLPGTCLRELAGISPSQLGAWGENAVNVDLFRCEALHSAHRFQDEVSAAQEARITYPDVLSFYALEGAALSALGRLQDLEKVLQLTASTVPRGGSGNAFGVRQTIALELRVHGQKQASRGLAGQLLQEVQSLPEEKQKGARGARIILLILLDRAPDAVDLARALANEATPAARRQAHAWGRLGGLLALTGHTEEARKVEQNLAAMTDPYLFGEQTYHRAGIVALLGEKERAVTLLRQAFGEGFRYDTEIHLDLFLEPLYGYAPYEALMKPKD